MSHRHAVSAEETCCVAQDTRSPGCRALETPGPGGQRCALQHIFVAQLQSSGFLHNAAVMLSNMLPAH